MPTRPGSERYSAADGRRRRRHPASDRAPPLYNSRARRDLFKHPVHYSSARLRLRISLSRVWYLGPALHCVCSSLVSPWSFAARERLLPSRCRASMLAVWRDAEVSESLLGTAGGRSPRAPTRLRCLGLGALVCAAALVVIASLRSWHRDAFLESAVWSTADSTRHTHSLPAPYEHQRMTVLYATSEREGDSYFRPEEPDRHVAVLVHIVGTHASGSLR